MTDTFKDAGVVGSRGVIFKFHERILNLGILESMNQNDGSEGVGD